MLNFNNFVLIKASPFKKSIFSYAPTFLSQSVVAEHRIFIFLLAKPPFELPEYSSL